MEKDEDGYSPHLTAEEADCCISFLEHEGLIRRQLRKYHEYEYEAVSSYICVERTGTTTILPESWTGLTSGARNESPGPAQAKLPRYLLLFLTHSNVHCHCL